MSIDKVDWQLGEFSLHQKDGNIDLRIFGNSEIYLGTTHNFKGFTFLSDTINGYIFIATSQEKNEYGKLKWYKITIAILILLLIIQFFIYKN